MSKIVPRGAGDARLLPVSDALRERYMERLLAETPIATMARETVKQALTKKRGRPVTGNAKSSAERVKAFRDRKRDQRLAG